MQALFPLGQIAATPGALETLARANQTPGEFLLRHISGDWGDMDAQDLAENMYSLKHGFRVMSSYRTKSGDTLWLITEADRASTTLLLPEEY
jgi:nucleoid-associated protein YgaU